MSNFEEAFKKIVDEEIEKRTRKGIKQRLRRGIIQVTKQMIKNKISDEIIMESTNLSKKNRRIKITSSIKNRQAF